MNRKIREPFNKCNTFHVVMFACRGILWRWVASNTEVGGVLL